MYNEKKIQNILFAVFAVIIVLLIIVVNKTEKDYKKSDPFLVNNPSTFFTIDGCANKYVNAIFSKNVVDVMKMLGNEYAKKNNIDSYNVLNKIGFDKDYASFSSKKMYQVDVNSEKVVYYIYGLLNENIMDEYPIGKEYYLKIDVDKKKMTFTVTPYEGKIFEGDTNE